MYYAHSPKNGVPAQEYAVHVNNVRKLSLGFAREMELYAKQGVTPLFSNLVEMAASFHDLGKLSNPNQSVLSGEKKSKSLPQNHVDAGAAHFLGDSSQTSAFAAALICAHHKGLPDFVSEGNRGDDTFRDSGLRSEIDRLLPSLERIHESLVSSVSPHGNSVIPDVDITVFLRLLLSCLVDGDHTDTALNYGKYPSVEEKSLLRPADRLLQLDRYVDAMNRGDERSVLRSEMYHASRDAEIAGNISSCDSPVGSGKTTAVMAHLLKQAEIRGLRRIFVVLPYTNIITQSVDVYRRALVLPGENPADIVAELHHRADFEDEDTRHLTALWRAPIIVTTAVGFFETMASKTTSTLRRLHELPGSAIFVDESHAALPAKLLPLAWKWINIYAEEWGCYWVLASGSLNRFWKIPEIASSVTAPAIVPEIVNDDLRERLGKYERNRIVYRHDLNPKSADELIDWVCSFPGPRLLILNTVQSAAVIADIMSRRFGRECVEHLSTALTSGDRKTTLGRVKKRLSSASDTAWTFVATSCVEAGVDLSFRTGFRELASLISLLQVSGRVCRTGEYPGAEMWTFCLAEGNKLKTNPGFKDSSKVLRDYIEMGMAISPDLSTKSIADEIRLKGVSKEYSVLVDQEINRRFPLVESGFRVIDSDTRIAVVNPDVVRQIECDVFDWRELQNNSVQIARYKLVEVKAREIVSGIYEWDRTYNDFLGYMAGVIDDVTVSPHALII